jgi:malonate-semialdehyde dehydrogenase (acetylating)/methylmalonate-semialdehyde dehydrogenase
LVDGRNCIVEGNENGFYVGATVIDFVTPDMAIAKGSVRSIARHYSCKDLDDAIG